jgi:hypothetical protein
MSTGKLAATTFRIGVSEVKKNVAECASKCTQYPTCQSYTFDSADKSCIINNVVYAKANTTAISAAGTVEWFDRIDAWGNIFM